MPWIDVGAAVGFMIVDVEVTNWHDFCTLSSQLMQLIQFVVHLLRMSKYNLDSSPESLNALYDVWLGGQPQLFQGG